MILKNLNIYYITCTSNHNIAFTNECSEYFQKCKDEGVLNAFEKSQINVPQNLKNLRNMQSEDLMRFYDNLTFESFFIISKFDDNNLYYYDILAVAKNNFSVEDFYELNFNIIKTKSITPVLFKDINYNYVNKIFNFDLLRKYNFEIVYDIDYFDEIKCLKYKNTIEYINYEQYKKQQSDLGNYTTMHIDNPTYWHYSNQSSGVRSQLINQRFLFKNYFYQFGFHWFVCEHEFKDKYSITNDNSTYLINELFLLNFFENQKPIGILTAAGEIKLFEDEYDCGCMFDLIDVLREFYSINILEISIPKILYNTKYKCRLKN